MSLKTHWRAFRLGFDLGSLMAARAMVIGLAVVVVVALYIPVKMLATRLQWLAGWLMTLDDRLEIAERYRAAE